MDILENIFSFLNFDQIANVKLTCNLFNLIIKQSNLQWRRVKITNQTLQNIKDDRLKYFRLIESIQLLDHIPFTLNIPNMPNLKKLSIVLDKRYVADESFLNYISKETMPCLDEFEIMIKPEYKHTGIITFLEKLFNNLNIKSLRITEYEPQPQNSHSYFSMISDHIFKLSSQLYSIHLDYVVISSSFNSWNVSSLRELKIKNLFFNNDSDINELISKISLASSLETLDITIESYISSFPLGDLLLALPETIRIIKLRSSHDIDVRMNYISICKRLESLKRLEIIDIDFNNENNFNIDDNETLKDFGNDISIGKILSKSCPYLNCLSLMHSFPKPNDILNLNLPYLRTLRLKCNDHLDPSELKNFHKKFPKLRNIHLKGSPNSKILKYIGKCKNIHSLSLKDSNVEFEDLEIFFDCGNGYNLLHLDIRSSKLNMNNKILKYLYNNSPNLSSLKFHLKKNTDITTDAYEQLIKNCKKLRRVKITTNVKLNSIVIEKFKVMGVVLDIS